MSSANDSGVGLRQRDDCIGDKSAGGVVNGSHDRSVNRLGKSRSGAQDRYREQRNTDPTRIIHEKQHPFTIHPRP
jgi:hypothetical protein